MAPSTNDPPLRAPPGSAHQLIEALPRNSPGGRQLIPSMTYALLETRPKVDEEDWEPRARLLFGAIKPTAHWMRPHPEEVTEAKKHGKTLLEEPPTAPSYRWAARALVLRRPDKLGWTWGIEDPAATTKDGWEWTHAQGRPALALERGVNVQHLASERFHKAYLLGRIHYSARLILDEFYIGLLRPHEYKPEPGPRRVPLESALGESSTASKEGFSRSGAFHDSQSVPMLGPLCRPTIRHSSLAKIQEEENGGKGGPGVMGKGQGTTMLEQKRQMATALEKSKEEEGKGGFKGRLFRSFRHKDS